MKQGSRLPPQISWEPLDRGVVVRRVYSDSGFDTKFGTVEKKLENSVDHADKIMENNEEIT
jgi:hypothetical protein